MRTSFHNLFIQEQKNVLLDNISGVIQQHPLLYMRAMMVMMMSEWRQKKSKEGKSFKTQKKNTAKQ